MIAALLGAVVACAATPGVDGVRAPGTTGTTRPKPAIATPVGEDPLAQPLEDRLQRVLDDTLARVTGTPGMIAAVWVPGSGAWASVTGVADPATKEALATNDHVRIGTVTTSMTVAVVLQLEDQGKLHLDDRVATWLPDEPGSSQTTVGSLTDSGADAATARSNTLLLARIAEKATGRPFRDLLEAQLLAPLGLHHTTVPAAGDTSLPRPFAQGSALVPTPGGPFDAAVDGAISTVLDLEIWAYHLGSGELLAPSTFAAQRDAGIAPAAPGSDFSAYGMGLMSFSPVQLPALPWAGFEGTASGTSTVVAFDPATSAVIVVIATSDVHLSDAGSGAPAGSGDGTVTPTPGPRRTPAMITFAALRDALRADPPPTTVPVLPTPASTAPGAAS